MATMTPQTIQKNNPTALKKNTFVRSGYEFQGWAESSGATTATYADQQTVTFSTDKTLYAVWKEVKYTVRFYKYESAATPVKTVTIAKGTSAASYAPTQAELGINGWVFDGWHDKAGITSISDGVTCDVSFYAYWYKEFNNILVQTAQLPAHQYTTSGAVEPNNKSEVWMAHLAWASELSMPAGATVSIAYLIGLLNHDGNQTKHYLSIAPCMVSSAIQWNSTVSVTNGEDVYYPNSFSNCNEEWTKVYVCSRDWDASKNRYVYTNSLSDKDVDLKMNLSRQPSQSSLITDWGIYAPLSGYNEFHFFDESSLINEKTGARFTVSDWNRIKPNYVGRWGSSNALNPLNHSHLSSTIHTTRSVDHALVLLDFDDYCMEGRTAYPIPATLGDGLPVNELRLFLSKDSQGCTVEWRLFIHQLKFDLR